MSCSIDPPDAAALHILLAGLSDYDAKLQRSQRLGGEAAAMARLMAGPAARARTWLEAVIEEGDRKPDWNEPGPPDTAAAERERWVAPGELVEIHGR